MSCIFQMLPIGLANIAMLGVTLGVAFSPEVTDAVNKNTTSTVDMIGVLAKINKETITVSSNFALSDFKNVSIIYPFVL